MNNRIIIKVNNPLEYIAVLIVGFTLCGFILFTFTNNSPLRSNHTAMGSFACGVVFIIYGLLGVVFKWKRKVAINTNGRAYKLYLKNKVRFIIYTSVVSSIFIYSSLLIPSLLFNSDMHYILMDFNNAYLIIGIYILLGLFIASFKYRHYKEAEKYLKSKTN